MLRRIFLGGACSILGAFPIAALVALCFRFPIPFSGYESGPLAVPRSLFAVLFYGVWGGFVVLAVLGALGGVLARRLAGGDVGKTRRFTLGFALLVDLVAVLIFSVLDKIIGPW